MILFYLGQQIYQLKENYGLEEIVINDLASEVDLSVNWEDYLKVCERKVTHFEYAI